MRVFKARAQAVDNNTIGAAVTTQERTLAGAVAPVFTATWGNKEKIAYGVAYGADENLVVIATNLISTERRVPVETTTSGATAGIPGGFTPSGGLVPAALANMATVAPIPPTAWTAGQYVTLGDASKASWNGTAWVVGPVATGATAGAPGAYTPAGSAAPGNFAVLAGVVASPQTAWTTGQRVALGDASLAYWNGTAWAVGTAAILMADEATVTEEQDEDEAVDEEDDEDDEDPEAEPKAPEAPRKATRRRPDHGEK